jgi:hypothetical protein
MNVGAVTVPVNVGLARTTLPEPVVTISSTTPVAPAIRPNTVLLLTF